GIPARISLPTQVNDYAYVDKVGKVFALDKDGNKIHCAVRFENLNYVGVQFDGTAICVKAETDADARVACKNGMYINPGNPQYQTTIGGTRGTNPDKYFYCVQATSRNKKSYACENVAKEESIYKNTESKITFRWQAVGGDGDCYCGRAGEKGEIKCAQEIPQFPDKCKDKQLARASEAEVNAMTAGPDKEMAMCSAISCKCNDGRIYAIGSIEKCNRPPDPVRADVPVVAQPSATVEDKLDENLKLCVDNWKEAANKCKTEADNAKKECKNDEAAQKQNAETSSVLNAANNMYVNSKAGSGAQQECFKGSLIANYAADLLSKKSDSCSSKTDLCASSCKPEELNKEKTRCHNILQVLQQGKPDEDNLNTKYFSEGDRLSNDLIMQGESLCGTAAKVDKSALSSALEGVGKSLAASVTCMCKLSNGSSADCSKIVPPASCETDASLPGCSQYGPIGVCTPGTTYDAKLCSCQTNPKGAGCPGGTASGGLVGFATGANINNTAGKDPGFGSPTSNLKPSGDADLSGVNGGPNGAAGNLKLEDTKTGGGNTGGIGGGSGGGGGGGEPTASAGGEVEEKSSGLNGLFNQAKSFMSNLGGSGNKKNNGDLKNGADKNKNPNMDKFRPRGTAANANGLGSKHMDIWKMMNSCTNGEKCQSNVNNYITGP
ncbi:MAG: hypothetical protein ABL930_12525, partial [Pseudobdellovibrio sp.]